MKDIIGALQKKSVILCGGSYELRQEIARKGIAGFQSSPGRHLFLLKENIKSWKDCLYEEDESYFHKVLSNYLSLSARLSGKTLFRTLVTLEKPIEGLEGRLSIFHHPNRTQPAIPASKVLDVIVI